MTVATSVFCSNNTSWTKHCQAVFKIPVQSNCPYWLNCGGFCPILMLICPIQHLSMRLCCKINPPFLPPPCVIDILARPLYLLSLESEKWHFWSDEMRKFPLPNLVMWLYYAYDGVPYSQQLEALFNMLMSYCAQSLLGRKQERAIVPLVTMQCVD